MKVISKLPQNGPLTNALRALINRTLKENTLLVINVNTMSYIYNL